MSTIVVKDLPDDLHERLKQQAKRHHRSVTKEVINLIDLAVPPEQRHADLPPAVKLKGGPLTIEQIEAAIEDGRFSEGRSLDDATAWVAELRRERDDVAP